MNGSIVTWKMPDPRIENELLLDRVERPVSVISLGEDVTAEIAYHCTRRVESPVFVLAIHRIDGIPALHAKTVLGGQIAVVGFRGRQSVISFFSPLKLAPGEYVMEASIFEHLDPGSTVMPPTTISMIVVTTSPSCVRLWWKWTWVSYIIPISWSMSPLRNQTMLATTQVSGHHP